MKKKLERAERLVINIGKEYGKISCESQFHDDMMYQRRGSIELYDEIEQYLKDGDIVFADSLIKDLVKTLNACKQANKVQLLIDEIKFVFG